MINTEVTWWVFCKSNYSLISPECLPAGGPACSVGQALPLEIILIAVVCFPETYPDDSGNGETVHP